MLMQTTQSKLRLSYSHLQDDGTLINHRPTEWGGYSRDYYYWGGHYTAIVNPNGTVKSLIDHKRSITHTGR